MRRPLLIACVVASLLGVSVYAAPQDITTLLAIFLRNLHAGQIVVPVTTAFASLPSATDGTAVYCSDCEAGTNPCTGSSTGAWAFRQGSAWVCGVDGSLSTPVAIASGGTGQTTATAAFDALAPTTTAGDISYHNGTDNVRLALGGAGLGLFSSGTAPVWAGVQTPLLVPSDFTTSSTSFVDITGLTGNTVANLAYSFDCLFVYTSTATTNGYGFGINATGTGATAYTLIRYQTATAVGTDSFSERFDTGLDQMPALLTAAAASPTNMIAQFHSTLYTGTTTGTFGIRVRSEAGSPSSVTVRSISYCGVMRLF